MVSVVTPTLRRPEEVRGLLENLCGQQLPPAELILVDGAPPEETATEEIVATVASKLPFRCVYVRRDGGTARQRNVGIDLAVGDLVAFVDDDIRLEPDFLHVMAAVFASDQVCRVGGVVGYRTNQHFTPADAPRWQWYRRLRLFRTYEPGRYDFDTGYPINANLQPPFTGVREVDFMTTSCAVWRREVFDAGLRFDKFFTDYGVLEDAHFALCAGRRWKLLQCGDARCAHNWSPLARMHHRRVGWKAVVNYYYVFQDIAGPLTWRQQTRFWRFQLFELARIAASVVCRRRMADVHNLRGRLDGFLAVLRTVGRR